MRARYKISCAVAAILSGCGGAAMAQQASQAIATAPSGAEEVVVTANRRSESVQKVPATIQAFTGKTLAALNVTSIDDLLKYTPNVTFATNGPGQGSVFMRGLSAGALGNQSSATIANFPNVALYLDDQSMQFPGRNIDIYMADMERVEVLEGPQGTLFGGGAEAGAVRYITNKPVLNKFTGNAEASYGFTSGGDPNSALNATINVPLIQDKLAVRAVIYDDQRGGYITNEPSTFTRSNQDIGNYYFGIKPNASGICPNKLPAGPNGCTLVGAPSANNSSVAGKASNPSAYTGARLSVLYDINPDWSVLIAQSFENLDSQGLSVEYPVGSDFQTLKPLENTFFTPSYDHDHYENTAWTLNGKVGPLKLIYTGGYMDRHISQQVDYTNYSRSGGGIYYECTGSATGFGTGAPTCYSPVGYWQDTVRNTHLSNEVRISSPDDWRFRFIAGVFNEQFRIYDVMNFNYKTVPACNATNLALAQSGGPTCVANVGTAPGSTANDPGVRGDSTAFGEDTQRGYDQTAVFGSVDFDIIPEVLTVSAGTRYYDYSEFEVGSEYYTSTACTDVLNGTCGSSVNIDSHHDKVTYTGFKSRANITWHPTKNLTLYYTFSQGFRPGGFNRTTKAVIKDAAGVAQFTEPNGYAPDSLTNNEIGLKSELFEHRLQLNLSAYYMNWDNVQVLLFNPTEQINTTFGINGANYNVEGVEAQFVGRITHGLTVQGSGTYNNDTQANSPCLKDNVTGTPAFGQCITQVRLSSGAIQTFANPFGTVGSVTAFSPSFQGNIRANYEWMIDAYKAHVTVGGNYVGSMYNEPATYPSGVGVTVPYTTALRYLQPGYGTLDAAIGVAKDNWTAELYGTNLLDSHASTFTTSGQFIKAEVPLRPTVIMVKIGASF